MPDDPGPRLRLPRRALWLAPAAVLALVALVGVAMSVPSAPGSSPTIPSAPVITASASAGATEPTQLEGVPQAGPPLQPARASRCRTAHEQVLRVLQFNIHFGISRSGAVDPGRIAAEIRAAHPDLVSLNEVDSGTLRSGRIDEAGYLASATGLHAVYGPNILWEGGVFGNAILSRYPVIEAHNLRLPGVAGLESRGLLTASVRIGGRTVSFSTTHLSDGNEGRVSRILQAQALTKVLADATRPTILAGDLNSEPGDLSVRMLRQYLLDSQEQAGTGPGDPGDTVPETDPTSRIDYILYDHHFAAVPGSTRVLPSASSDHRSVLTELALVPDGPCRS